LFDSRKVSFIECYVSVMSVDCKLNRREFLKLTTLAGASYLLCNCGDDNPDIDPIPTPEPDPQPVYELTDGTTWYDNFDGLGGLQSYNNQHLAVAGQLSSQLWDHGPSSTVVDNPSDNLTVLNEKWQYVKYSRLDTYVQKIISYFQENARPVTYWERVTFQKLLNKRGIELVAHIEEKKLNKQHIILQYVFSNRRAIFNKRGLHLDALITEKTKNEIMAQDSLNSLVKGGFDENEVAVFFNLYQEKELYDGSFKRKLSKAGKEGIERVGTVLGTETKFEPFEYKYTFDKNGNLLSADPHIQGQPYHGSRQLRWVDNRGQVRAFAQPECFVSAKFGQRMIFLKL